MDKKRYRLFEVVLRYYFFSFILTLLLLFVFYLQTTGVENTMGLFYVLTIPTYYYIILLIVSLLITPIGSITGLKYLPMIPKVLFDTFLLADIFVFRIYRFHIDMMFFNMLLHDFKGIGLSFTMVFFSFIAFAIIVWINGWIFKLTLHHKLIKLPVIKIHLFILIFFLTGQSLHIWAYDYNKKYITKYTPYFPYFYPTISHITMLKLQKKFPNTFPKPVYNPDNQAKSILSETTDSGTIFNYPIHPLVFPDSISDKPNILFFVTESWRTDMMTPQVTPGIYRFSEHCYNFMNHKSSGNVTVSGLFGLMYGLHASYLQYAQATPYKNQSLLTRALQENGYTISAYTASNLDRFALKPMFFGAIPPSNFTYQKKLSTVANDRYLVDLLIRDIKKDTLKPWFKFIFLNSSHHSYKYPEEHKIFKPVPGNSEGFVFDKNIDSTPFLNAYKNSLHYVDSLFEDIYQTLEASGNLDNTFIIVTSDHGEEFNDNGVGYWGHGSNFTKYQTTVPLLLKIPHLTTPKKIYSLSSHIDVVPTVLQAVLQVSNPISDFSSGQNLLSLPEQRGLIIRSYVDKAYLIQGQVYANGLSFKSYSQDSITQINTDFDYKDLRILRQEETHFIRR